MLKKIIKHNARLFALILEWKELNNKIKIKLNNFEKEILGELNEKGVVAIPNFFSEYECNNLIKSFEEISDKYAKFYDNDKRIFGIQCLSKLHKNLFYDNEFLKKIARAYLGDEVYLQTTMAAKIIADKNAQYGSGGGWHRDSFSRQFKAIAYLNDVTMENGPFMYIKTSHTLENIKKVLFELDRDTYPGNYRYTDEEIEKIKDILNQDISYITAPKGSLVLADVRGLHTGSPLKEGFRYSIFNYYIAKSFRQKGSIIEQLNIENCKKGKYK